MLVNFLSFITVTYLDMSTYFVGVDCLQGTHNHKQHTHLI